MNSSITNNYKCLYKKAVFWIQTGKSLDFLLLCHPQSLCSTATMQTVRTADTNEVDKLIFRESDNDRKVGWIVYIFSFILLYIFFCNLLSSTVKYLEEPNTVALVQPGTNIWPAAKQEIKQSQHICPKCLPNKSGKLSPLHSLAFYVSPPHEVFIKLDKSGTETWMWPY